MSKSGERKVVTEQRLNETTNKEKQSDHCKGNSYLRWEEVEKSNL